jgi:hypothetical protein
MGPPGSPCTPEAADAGNANYGCSADRTQELVCDPATRKLKVWSFCRGEKGSSLENDTVHCDQSTARPGEACQRAGAHACNEDGGTELQCSPQLSWTTQRECLLGLGGCQVKSNAVLCE